MARRSLTDRTLKALKPAPAGKRYDVWDAVVPGFGVRVTDTGHRSFVLVTRYPGSTTPTRRKLGEYPALPLEKARGKARDWVEMIRKGVDPAEAEDIARRAALRTRKNTFGVVAEAFIQFIKADGQRKAREVERNLRKEFISRWEARAITDIAAADVAEVVQAAVNRGSPYMAHNLLDNVRQLFNWALVQPHFGLENSPCARLKPKKLIGKRALRTRVLTDDEVRAFWRATVRMQYPLGPMFRLMLVTIQRKSEVAEAMRSEIDLGAAVWTIPAERMKMEAAHVVPLSATAVALFSSLPKFPGEFLFTTTFGDKPVNGFSKAKALLDKLMLEELRAIAVERGGDPRAVELRPWVLHDLRRTGRTALSSLPVPEMVRELVIAHTKPGLHKVYDQHAYLAEKKHALELWAARLRSIVEPAQSNVVDLAVARS